uniref:STAS domain-containing protein n=1 Tax=Schistocephalus solidus TaxID=70667 RepID=A0A0X3PQY4_SCHSO
MDGNLNDGHRPIYKVDRLTFSDPEFCDEYEILPKRQITFSSLRDSCLKLRLKNFGFAICPAFTSLCSFYKLNDFLLDVVSGITMAIFHIPQGMAYGSLAGLSPVNGLYTSFFPVLIYILFGTSRHISVGTFSLSSLLFSSPVNRLASGFNQHENITNRAFSEEETTFRLQVAITLTLSIGLVQLTMGLLQLGFLVTYLSGPLISGFTCASAFHILASQMSGLFGVNVPSYYGPGNLVMSYYAVLSRLAQTNIATLIISIICIVVLYLFRNLINPRFKKRFKFPIPAEILIVAVATIVSEFAKLNERYEVSIVGEIPRGLPVPIVPSFNMFNEVVGDVFVIAIVTFAISASLVKLYATEYGYDVLYNQELVALGLSNIFGSFFQCIASCGALARSAVVVSVGMVSQIASLISCIIILIILYVIGPYLQSLPKAVLSSVIVVALTSTFMKFKDLKKLWKVSICDALIWLVVFLATCFIDIPFGLVTGFGFSLLTIVYRSQYGGRTTLGRAGTTGIYSELKRFDKLEEVDRIKIIRFDGPVYFASAESFQNTIYRLSGLDPSKTKHHHRHHHKHLIIHCCNKSRKQADDVTLEGSPGGDPKGSVTDPQVQADAETEQTAQNSPTANDLRFIILDASSWLFIDTVGIRAITNVVKQYAFLGVEVFIANCRLSLLRHFETSGAYAVLPADHFFVTLHDAVLVAQDYLASNRPVVSSLVSAVEVSDKNGKNDGCGSDFEEIFEDSVLEVL